MTDDVNVKFGADTASATAAIKQLQETFEHMAAPISGIVSAFNHVGRPSRMTSLVSQRAWLMRLSICLAFTDQLWCLRCRKIGHAVRGSMRRAIRFGRLSTISSQAIRCCIFAARNSDGSILFWTRAKHAHSVRR
jgi:hypothetical protein